METRLNWKKIWKKFDKNFTKLEKNEGLCITWKSQQKIIKKYVEEEVKDYLFS